MSILGSLGAVDCKAINAITAAGGWTQVEVPLDAIMCGGIVKLSRADHTHDGVYSGHIDCVLTESVCDAIKDILEGKESKSQEHQQGQYLIDQGLIDRAQSGYINHILVYSYDEDSTYKQLDVFLAKKAACAPSK